MLRTFQRLALLGTVLATWHAAGAQARATDWMSTLQDIALLPDPFAAVALNRLVPTASLPAPHCVSTEVPSPSLKCWSSATDPASGVTLTLAYTTSTAMQPAHNGSLELELPALPCVSREQAETAFRKEFVMVPLQGEPWGADASYHAYLTRLFGDKMQPLSLQLQLHGACIVKATLSRAGER